MIDGIILDVDGTIWNTTSVVANAWNNAIDKLFPQIPHVSADILKGQFGKTMDVIADNLFNLISAKDRKILIDECCIEEHIAIKNNEIDITYPDVVSTIKKLAESFPIFIVSNCQSGYIELVMEKNKIKEYIKDFECFGNTLKTKDENIKLIIERNSLRNPVYVGDTQGDYEACIKSNVKFIWASYGFGHPDDNNYFLKIEKFSDLLKLID